MPESVLRFRVETADTNRKVAKLEEQVRKLEVAVKNAGGTTRSASAGFKAFGSSAQAAGVGVKGFGAALGAALGPITAVVAAVGSLGQVFGVLRQQDFAEAKVRSLGVNSEELKTRLSDVSRELSGQASVVDLTAAAYDVASAGFTNAADAANILKAASQGATGGFSDINTVGDAATSVLNAYGLEADKASKLVDGFIQTQNDGKIVIGEYAANIAKVAPVAAALGVPLEEVNAAVAQITAGGEKAEVTFTALKSAFSSVAAGKVGNVFKELGVEINASTLKTDGLAGTLEKIKATGADAGTIIKAFGTEAGPAILALLNNTEKYNELLEKQKNAQGAAAKSASTASDTIDGQIKRLTTAFQNLFAEQSELGIVLKETFKVAAVTVEVLAVGISNTLSPIRALFAAANEVGTAIAEALGIKGLNAAFELEKGFQIVLGNAKRFGDFVVGLGVRVGQIVGGLAKQIIDKGKNSLETVINFFKSALEKIVGFIGSAYNLIPKPIRDFIEGGVSAVGSFVQDTVALGQGVTQGAAGTQLQQQQQQQQLPQNTINQTGGALNKTTKERVDMSDKMLELNRRLREEQELGNEREIATLQLMVEKQKISEQDLLANQRTNKLEQATAKFRQKIFAIDQKAAELAERERQKREADEQAKREADPGFQMKQQLEELLKLENQVAAGATAIGNAFANSFVSVVKGSKTAQEALADMMASIAEHFLEMAAKIIAQQIAMIIYGTIMKALGVGLPTMKTGPAAGLTADFTKADPSTLSSLGYQFAEGGYVSGPTNALIGEGGESEYVIPESKMRTAMSRYSRGARGAAVVPETGESGTSGEGGGTAVAEPIDVRFSVERINQVDYVTAEQFQAGMQRAAKQGAAEGERRALGSIRNSSAVRRRIGV